MDRADNKGQDFTRHSRVLRLELNGASRAGGRDQVIVNRVWRVAFVFAFGAAGDIKIRLSIALLVCARRIASYGGLPVSREIVSGTPKWTGAHANAPRRSRSSAPFGPR